MKQEPWIVEVWAPGEARCPACGGCRCHKLPRIVVWRGARTWIRHQPVAPGVTVDELVDWFAKLPEEVEVPRVSIESLLSVVERVRDGVDGLVSLSFQVKGLDVRIRLTAQGHVEDPARKGES